MYVYISISIYIYRYNIYTYEITAESRKASVRKITFLDVKLCEALVVGQRTQRPGLYMYCVLVVSSSK